ncbi:von Willebrand factor A [Salinisphaera shabanensis T35B1]|uniref:VWA domain-containing protein n=1 Tax=Salinisphaera TaxID=180541 RepID=UPI0033427886
MSNLTKSLPIVAKILGDKYGVRVAIGGSQACTDGQTIYLPALPADDEKAAVLVRGYIDHEAAHVRFTEGGLEGSPLERALQNILEDIRIERRIGKRFPGCVGNLDRLVSTLVADGMFERLPDDAHPGAVLQMYLLHRMRHDVLEQSALKNLADHSESLFHKVFSKGKATRISAIAWHAENAASTHEIKTLVSRILESMQEPEEEEEPDTGNSQDAPQQASDSSQGQQDDSQQSGQSDDSQSDTSGSDQSDASGDGDEDDQGSSTQQSAADDSGDDQADENPSSSQNSAEQGSGHGGQDDIEEAVERALSATEQDLMADVAQQVADMLEEHASDCPYEAAVNVAEDRDDYIRQFGVINAKEARKTTNALRSRLDGLIQASKQQRNPPRRTGRRLDSRSLARLSCGDMRVFKSSSERKAVNTAVHVLLDRSGSMNQEIATACAAVYATADALAGISGVHLETAAFPVKNDGVKTLTRFGERVCIDAYEMGANGSTPMAQALWHVAYRLVAQKQPRKIALVITDGDPDDRAATVDVIARMEAAGIETIGIGIGSNAKEHLFSRHRKILSVDELPNALFGLLEQPLMAQSA